MEKRVNEFIILQFGVNYTMQKICNETGKLMRVTLNQEEFHQYYTSKGKCVKNLKHLTKEEKLFLETTLTKAEIESLHEEVKETERKLWKKYYRWKLLGQKDK